ncbi:CHAT domain-containing protein [Catenulispora rubra]|uniref:CHAT domain-containing protein n=1 Tax=Catenulispora rubra TaxID=280293 RepID=UPI0018925A6A|nr:CHAT domain-containing protein [Catenulispora rubra]
MFQELAQIGEQVAESGKFDSARAVRAARAGLAATPADSCDHGLFQHYLGVALLHRSNLSLDEQDLVEALHALRIAVALVPEGHPEHSDIVITLEGATLRSALVSGGRETFEEVIATARARVAAMPDDDPRHTLGMISLGHALRGLGGQNHDVAMLEESVSVTRATLDSLPSDWQLAHVCQFSLGVCLWTLYRENNDTNALGQAITAIKEAIANAPEGIPEVQAYWDLLGDALEEHYKVTADVDVLAESLHAGRASGLTGATYLVDSARRLVMLAGHTGSPDMLTEAADAWRAVVAATAADDQNHAVRQSQLCSALATLYERTGRVEHLQEAVQAGRAAVTSAPGVLTHWTDLAEAWHLLFDTTADLDALAQMDAILREAAALPGLSDEDRGICLNGLSVTLHLRYEQTGDAASLTQAIAFEREALLTTPDDPTYLSNLGAALCSEFECSADLGALAEGVDACRAAVAATAHDSSDRALRLENLASAAATLFHRTSDSDLLDEAVAAAREVASSVSAGETVNAESAGHLSNVATTLLACYLHTGETEVLAEAVAASRASVIAYPPDAPNRARILSNHAVILATTYLRTGESELLDEAMETGRAAATPASARHAEYATRLTNLGTLLLTAYSRTGDPETLRQAEEASRASLAEARPDQPDYPRYQSNLAIILAYSYLRTGDRQSAADALDHARRAVAATDQQSLDLARCQSNLVIVLLCVYRRTQELEALQQAVAAGRAAASVGPAASVYAYCQSNLAQALAVLYLRTGSVDLLTEAEQSARAALAAAGETMRAIVLSHLGAVLVGRYGEDESLDTLTEAVAALRQADDSALVNDPSRGMLRTNRCRALLLLYDHERDLGLLEEAVAAARSGLTALTDQAPDNARASTVLARALRMLHEETGQSQPLAEARAVLVKAFRSASPPLDRIEAGLERAHAETLAGDLNACVAAMEGVMELIPLVAPGGLRRNDREHRLGETAGIAAAAAASAAAVDAPGRGVQFLEQARGQLLSEAMDARVNIRRLQQHAPELVEDFESQRAHATDAEVPLLLAPEFAVPHPDLARGPQHETDDGSALLARIRSRPGLADFMIAPSLEELYTQAQDGPIVMVSAAWNRGDALIVTRDPLRPVLQVPLPGLTSDTAFDTAVRLYTARQTATEDPDLRRRPPAQRDLLDTLAWLWDTIAEPVLTALGHTSAHREGRWPRLWWSPVGTLALLPLHAAGHHNEVGQTVMDRIISSYTPTIRALAYSRQVRPRPDNAGKYLIVTMPDTPDTHSASALHRIEEEAALVASLLPGARVLTGPEATHQSVAESLQGRQITHFACHSLSDWDNPGLGKLLLHDHATDPLTVEAVSRQHLAGAELAYLSACSTTAASLRLLDESLHITSAFQLAGYRSVIGTLWPVSDHAATRVATDVYRHLTADGTRPPDTSAAAQALHHATRRLRADLPSLPTAWAAHIHSGA